MTDATALPGVDAAVERVLDALETPGVVVTLEGQPTSGKTTVLARVEERLRCSARSVVSVDIPIQRGSPAPSSHFGGIADDAAGVMLASAAGQLTAIDDGLPECVADAAVAWSDKVERVGRALQCVASNGPCVILLDGASVSLDRDAFDSVFSVRARDLLRVWLCCTELSWVVAQRPPATVARVRSVWVESRSRSSEMLDPSRWNGMAESARKLRAEVEQDVLDDYSPLELRLAVALIHAGEPVGTIARSQPRRRQLIQALFQRLGEASTDLMRVLGKLAVFRVPFPRESLKEFGVADLSEGARHVLENAILFEDGGMLRLHELFARESVLRKWLDPSERKASHRVAAGYHSKRFAQAIRQGDPLGGLRHEMEAFHHLSEAADPKALDKARAFFVEQLDGLGKSLSLQGRFADAVTCYERALDRDEEDWYAHHYLAYNLDVQGLEPERVETHYEEARSLAAWHVWHHGRLICFHITRGWARRAEEAWRAALDRFAFHNEEADERFYRELHRPVARLLLHRGQLDFGEQVLTDVPEALSGELSWHRALSDLLVRLAEAELNQVVFPPHIPVEERWAGPHTLLDESARESVSEWMPGRISSIDDRSVHVRVAKRDPHAAEPRFGWADYSRAEFDRRCEYPAKKLQVPAGTFVEIIRLGKSTEKILIHSPGRPDPELPGLHPPPDRYVRRGTA